MKNQLTRALFPIAMTLVMLVSVSIHAAGTTPSLDTEQEARHEIEKRFDAGFFEGLFSNDTLPQKLRQTVEDDLISLWRIRGTGSTSLHQKIMGGPVDGRLYLRWFLKRVHAIRYDHAEHQISGLEVGAYSPDLGSGTLYLMDNYLSGLNLGTNPALRQMLLLHEARHAASDGVGHINCTSPTPFEGDLYSQFSPTPIGAPGSCDADPFGAYGLETVVADNIAEYCANCDDLMITQMRNAASDVINRVMGSGREALEKDLYPAELYVDALENGQFSLVKTYSDEGMDINAIARFGDTTLGAAPSIDVVNLLISLGADIRKQDQKHSAGIVAQQIQNGRPEVAKYLIGLGADPTFPKRQPPLDVAVLFHHRDSISFLASDPRVKIDAQDIGGKTILMRALDQIAVDLRSTDAWDQGDATKLASAALTLIHDGASLDLKDKKGLSARDRIQRLPKQFAERSTLADIYNGSTNR